MERTSPLPQYRPVILLLIWSAAALPMGALGWIAAPALAPEGAPPGFVRLAVLTAGLAWQFVLVVLLLRREGAPLTGRALRGRLWLQSPRDPGGDRPRARLWAWLLPILVLTAAFDVVAKPRIDAAWVSVLPFLAEPPAWSLGAALATPEARDQLVGAWGVLALLAVNALLNTFIGEELLFRGLLLPRMGAMGRWDWAVNGLLFGLYHLHQPWAIVSSAIRGALLYALPTRTFRSAWMGVAAHSGQSIYFLILMLGIVLGLA